MKRVVQEIAEDLTALERALKLIKRQRTILKEEWYDHPDNIRSQLELWSVPAGVIEKANIKSLLVDYKPGAESETVGAGTVLVEREDWSISIGLDSITHTHLATRWTGQSWEGDFEVLEEEEEDFGVSEEGSSWETALRKNDGELTKAIASMGLKAFYNDGEDSIIKPT